MLGWMLDAMDVLLFTFAVVPIRNEFHISNAAIGALSTATLVASALGGVFFGALADRIGRVRAMTFSILLYSFATAAMALSQNFAQLLALRVLVGLGMGGEWSCGSVLVAETWPAELRGKAIGLMQSGWALGAMVAAALSAVLLETAGWRVLFLAGALPAVAAFFIRRTVQEPQIWRDQKVRAPLTAIFASEHITRVVIATALASSVLVAFWGVTAWLPAFLSLPQSEGGAGLTLTKSATWMLILQAGAFFGYISFGWIADRIGRRPAFTAFMVAAAIVIPLFAFGARSDLTLLIVGPLVGYFAHGYFSLFGAALAELFPTSIRGTAQGFCYNAGRLASAVAPFVIGMRADAKGLATAIAFNSMFFLIGGALVWLLPETRGRELASS